ncbi:hypothetical protein [Yinghuangia sp. YIM S09857]|uniref:hypothetical protein n=1 Tax=Yinghuangia sp. YIM S09857 TaxID=3436929 RepID=UPI003F531D2E
MKRTLGALAVAPLAAGLLIFGAGAAVADNGADANNGSTSSATTTSTSTTSNTGSGNVSGGLDGNYNATQQSANGAGATNQNNTAGVKDNGGVVVIEQGNNSNGQSQQGAWGGFFPFWF